MSNMGLPITMCALVTACMTSGSALYDTPYIFVPGSGVCLLMGSNCRKQVNGFQRYWLYSLNVERFYLNVGETSKLPIPTNMQLLHSDDKLIQEAQKYAETCLKDHGVDGCVQHGGSAGKNDAFISVERIPFSTIEDPDLRLVAKIMEWRDDFKAFSPDELEIISSYNNNLGGVKLHKFATLMHADVWKVGCGMADFDYSDNEFIEVFTCFFGPPKLRNGDQVYIPGCWPCKNCPEGSTCIKDRKDLFHNVLCNVSSSNVQIHSDTIVSEKICKVLPDSAPSKDEDHVESTTITSKEVQTPSVTTPFASSELIDNFEEKDVEKCRGEICSSEWEYGMGSAKLNIKGRCISTVTFKKLFDIQDYSCFEFHYTMHTKVNTSSSDRVVIAFAFDANNKSNHQHTTKNGDNENKICLAIPWRNAQVHVGFGTLSRSLSNAYEVTVRQFRIRSGECEKSSENSNVIVLSNT